AQGWFHTGDLGVRHPDGYVEIKDRSKDIIISGGENISSLEVEDTLYRHPQIIEAAGVAKPDPVWGETPCAFVTLKPDAGAPASAARPPAPVSRASRTPASARPPISLPGAVPISRITRCRALWSLACC